ncbi:MAG: hypothetical protein II350_09905 [Clostridia bacterium]|nr:hypothetical protein [Clostridia bacterium]
MNVKIAFEFKELPMYLVSINNGRKSLELEAFDGVLTVAVRYDYDRNSLLLKSDVKAGDSAEIILLDHRIELYVNGELKDEEWPTGNRIFEIGDAFIPDANVAVSEVRETTVAAPNVVSTFENAEGWYPGNGVFVGDCMPYRKNDEYHVLYLKDRHHHRSKWGLGAHQWDHISTKDFHTWQVHPMAVPITESWEGSICTGSWIANNGKEYLYYTVRRGKDLPAPICRSVSTDGYHFEKDKDFSFIVSDKYHKASARDPKVVFGEDGLFHMFLTTSLVKENKGCLAHYVSADMETWAEQENPIYVSANADQPECPDYFKYNGKYYLIFSLCGNAHYMISDKPFEDFAMPADPIIPCESVPKGAEWNGRLVFTGFKGLNGYAGSMTFKAARADESGELVFEEL